MTTRATSSTSSSERGPRVKAVLDVHYEDGEALAACGLFRDFADERFEREVTRRVSPVAPYEPGAFYRRELPCLLAVLGEVEAPLDLIFVDGYVWLDAAGRRGLGAHLHEALAERVPVVGVAKTAFAGSAFAEPALRGASKKPLYITAVGIDAKVAAAHVRSMHGEHRVPTLLARVDRLARGG